MAFKKKQAGGEAGAGDSDLAPPLPARVVVGGEKSSGNGTKNARSLSFSSNSSSSGGGGGGVSLPPQHAPPPIPSRPSTATSSRSNSVSGMGSSGLVIEGGSTSSSSVVATTTSSYVSSLLTRNPLTSGSISGSSFGGSAGDRVNPFDKNVSGSIINTSTTTTTAVEGSSPPLKDVPGTSTLDDLIKNRFVNKQGVQDEATGRYKPKLADAKPEQSFEEMKNELFRKEEKKPEHKWSETDSVFSSSVSPKVGVDAKPSAFGKFSRTSSSDADIIFGGSTTTMTSSSVSPMPSARPKYNYSIDSQSSVSSDADNIFGRRDEGRSFLKSLSVSSTDDREFSSDPRVKNYDGVQNAAFQDTDSGMGTYKSTTASVSSVGSYKWSSSNRVGEEDYDDLK